jgi:acetyl-CoA carboxylase biotin carboxyl carrier protein
MVWAKQQEMAENKKAHAHLEPSDIAQFIRKQVDPLSKTFAETPLARLRVKTQQGEIMLEKAVAQSVSAQPAIKVAEVSKPSGDGSKTAAPRYTPLVPASNGEAGRSYVTINAEVVGIFRDLPAPPAPGEKLRSGQVLGYIEALRLRNEVHCPADSTLVAQVVVDSQPVDFGEALFVVDTTETIAAQLHDGASEIAATVAVSESAEPPRL